MQIIRQVPLGSGLRAATEAMPTPGTTDPAEEAFFEWFNQPRTGGRSVLDHVALPVAEIEALLPEVPRTSCGAAWADAVRDSMERTLADQPRPYDQARLDTEAERAACASLDRLAEEVRETSPLLEEVAHEVEQQVLHEPFYLGDVAHQRTRLRNEGLTVGPQGDGYCDKHDEHCYPDERRVASWEHIEMLHPGFEARLRELLNQLDAALPDTAEHDNGAARTSGPQD